MDAALVSVAGTRWHPVHAALEFQLGIGAAAIHFQRGVLDSRPDRFRSVHHFGAPALQPQ
jgi:hypothetical protein